MNFWRARVLAFALLPAACAQSAQRKATADMAVIRAETTPLRLQ